MPAETLTIAGTIENNASSVVDTGGYFGPAGASLDGDTVELQISLNPQDFFNQGGYYENTTSDGVDVTLTINGHAVTTPEEPAGDTTFALDPFIPPGSFGISIYT